MCRIPCCILLAALSLNGQSTQAVAQLSPPLSKALLSAGAPDDVVGQTLVQTMMSISLPDHRPVEQDVARLAGALRGALAGRRIGEAQISMLSQCIADVLSATKISNFALASRVREELTSLRVDDTRADLIVRRFIAVGQGVRGPDDTPVVEEIQFMSPQKAK